MKTRMTLCELSNLLTAKGYQDIFDGQVVGECLDKKSMSGSWSDPDGEEIVYFDIIKWDSASQHLETIIEIEE